MNYKIALDPSKGGSDYGVIGNDIVEKNYNLLISKYISDRLNEFNIDNMLTRNNDTFISLDDRINNINNKYGSENDVIVISNNLKDGEKGVEIIYALRNSNALSYLISKSLEESGFTVNKYYQLRDSDNTSLDSEYLIRETNNNETIEIFYGSVEDEEDANNIKNNYQKYAEAVVKGLLDYLDITYIPKDKNTYIVKKGDSLYSIAKTYNTTVNTLKTLNNLTSNNLSIGQILKVPEIVQKEETSTDNIYVVKKGDNLYNIAKTYNTTVNTLKTLNNLTSNNLSIGQTLKLPSSTYIVKKGDNLYSIAKKYNTTVNNLKTLNNLTNNNLSIGQTLKIN